MGGAEALPLELVGILDRALRALGRAGEADLAAQLAAEAWARLRPGHPREAERINGTLHYLAARLGAHGREGDSVTGGAPVDATSSLRRRGGREMDGTREAVLDVRELPPAERHERIFQTYAALLAGESFVLVNDHDPKPLYYQFAAEEPGRFAWEYVESGPEVWRVRIGRV